MGLNLGRPPVEANLETSGDVVRFGPPWVNWLRVAGIVVFDLQNSGPTSDRPTDDMYIGKFYFDTDLGVPIWFNGTDWVDGTGAIA